ncbi:MAG: ferritin-like domain-containing protein [Acidimicrobiia bacterium]
MPKQHHLTLEVVDPDGIAEVLDERTADSRAAFLKKAVAAGGGIALGGILIGGLPALVGAAPGPQQDQAILNFALLLEYLEAEFYTQAENGGALDGEALEFARVVGEHERQHVAFLEQALGDAANPKPTFDFMGTTQDQQQFLQTAIVLEDTGVAAYNGQGARLTKETLAAAASIVSVEARHAAWVRDIVGEPPAPNVVDPLQTMEEITAAVNETGFIQS